MAETTIACEQCGATQATTTHLAIHLIEHHDMERTAAIREAKETRARVLATPEERIKRAAPDLLRELEAAVTWIEQIVSYEIFDPSAPSKHELLPQLRAAIAKAKGTDGD